MQQFEVQKRLHLSLCTHRPSFMVTLIHPFRLNLRGAVQVLEEMQTYLAYVSSLTKRVRFHLTILARVHSKQMYFKTCGSIGGMPNTSEAVEVGSFSLCPEFIPSSS
ncbi:unnamed protein product [Sphenostylis stenocarpa]|uniref:Uncharacterized protein n=1 Tax=Sphenostylis stenocarpa TaxID=92480 RepID=A0AA86S7P0_9FABA|nr:unnamed protein product [Sphenostylis stenocarpa]